MQVSEHPNLRRAAAAVIIDGPAGRPPTEYTATETEKKPRSRIVRERGGWSECESMLGIERERKGKGVRWCWKDVVDLGICARVRKIV